VLLCFIKPTLGNRYGPGVMQGTWGGRILVHLRKPGCSAECVLNSSSRTSLFGRASVLDSSRFSLCVALLLNCLVLSLFCVFSSIPPFMRSSTSLLALLVSVRSLSLLYDPSHIHLILPINLPPTDFPQHIYAYSAIFCDQNVFRISQGAFQKWSSPSSDRASY